MTTTLERETTLERQRTEQPTGAGRDPGTTALDSPACDALTWLGRELVWERQLETLRRRRPVEV